MKWAFQIERTTLSLRNLHDLLGSIGYQGVDVPGQELVFWSETLEGCSNPDEVWEEAKRLRELISEITEIDPEIVLGPVLDLTTEEVKRYQFAEVKSGITATASISATLTVSPPAGLSEEQIAEWNERRVEQQYQIKLEAQRAKLEPAFQEPRAAKVLRLLKRSNHNGESLYKIYELAEKHPSHRDNFHAKFKIAKDEFRRFTDAVHNPVVSGELARHAYEGKPKTSNPMTFAEAQSFVFDIAKRWLASLRV